jgi:ATP-binding cassette subfamily F protein 3
LAGRFGHYAAMLTLNDISLRIAGRLLIDHATLSLPAGTKAGLVGRNGTGKTTLFRAITGELGLETGSISLPKNIRIGQVAQEAPATEESLIEIVLKADTERVDLLAEAETARDPHRIAEIQIRLADIEAHSAEARAASILAGLGFDQAAQLRPASSFSGGWRMRVALAAVLFAQPDLLMLDEPTNYLDLEGTMWLESYLAKYPHTVLLISHDRDLLNACVTSIVHLDQQKLTLWRGGYDQFERQFAEQRELMGKLKGKQDAQRKHMESFVERFRAKASKARQAQSRLKALAKLPPVMVMDETSARPFRFSEAEKKVASPAISMRGVAVGYTPDKPVLKSLTLRIDADDRIALLGSNGNGKSTFAKLLAKRLQSENGEIVIAPNLKVAMFAQHQMDDLHADETPVDHVRRLMPQASEASVRARVAQMGLGTEKMGTKAEKLSGGEKARLLMGLATFEGPNLLILDEPTNHLDIDSRRALVDALNDFEGAVILIAHDRYLLEATAERLWIVENGNVAPFDGDMDDYRRHVLSASKAKPADDAEEAVKPGLSKADQRREAAQRRDALKPLRKKINEIEALNEKLTKEIQVIDTKLADPMLYASNPDEAARLSQKRIDTLNRLAESEEKWMTLSQDYESQWKL